MTKEEILEYHSEWSKDKDIEHANSVWKEQSKKFHKFWQEKIYGPGILTDEAINEVLVMIEWEALGAGEFRKQGGYTVARSGNPNIRWRKVFYNIKEDKQLKELLNKIFERSDDESTSIDLINELKNKYEGRASGLTGAQTCILSALLFINNPQHYINLVSLRYRVSIIEKFGLGSSSYYSYGEKTVKSHRQIIDGFREKLGITYSPYNIANFIEYLDWYWNPKIHKTNEINNSLEINETKVLSQRNKIPESIRNAVWRRDRGQCAECGSRKNLEFDHIIPVSKGGGNTVRNIDLLCESCNRKKSDRI